MTGKQAASYTTKKPDGSYALWTGDRLTKEELAVVVEKHNKGLLIKGGLVMGYVPDGSGKVEYNEAAQGCIMQHLCQEPSPARAFGRNFAVAVWFDYNYDSRWTEEQLLDAMTKAKMIEE